MKKLPPKKFPLRVSPTKSERRVLWRDDRRRNLQVAAEALAAPVRFETDPECRDGYLLYESSRLIARWREPDHPGFAAWLMQRMDERHRALALSRSELVANPKRIEGGVTAGKNSANPHRSQVEQLVRASRLRTEDPKAKAADWAEEFGYSKRQIYNIIKNTL